MEVPLAPPASVRRNAHREGGVKKMGGCGAVIVQVPGVLVRGIDNSGSSRGVMLNIDGVDGVVDFPPTLGWMCTGTVSGPFASGVELSEADKKGGVIGSGGWVWRAVLPRAVWPAIGHSGWWPCLRRWCAD